MVSAYEMMKKIAFLLFLYFYTVQRQQVLDMLLCSQDFLIMRKKIKHQQLTLVLRLLHVEFSNL